MKKNNILRAMAVVCVGIVMTVALVGCVSANTETEDAATENRSYMSKVSQIMDGLNTKLDGFGKAVSDNDIVSMKTQAADASKSISELEKLTVPGGVTEIHEGYVQGCTSLKNALESYIALYSEIQKATNEEPFDYSTYDARIEEIKTVYDEGIEQLEKADKLAIESE